MLRSTRPLTPSGTPSRRRSTGRDGPTIRSATGCRASKRDGRWIWISATCCGQLARHMRANLPRERGGVLLVITGCTKADLERLRGRTPDQVKQACDPQRQTPEMFTSVLGTSDRGQHRRQAPRPTVSIRTVARLDQGKEPKRTGCDEADRGMKVDRSRKRTIKSLVLNRSVSINGHNTSVSIEGAVLERAHRKSRSLNKQVPVLSFRRSTVSAEPPPTYRRPSVYMLSNTIASPRMRELILSDRDDV